MDIQFLIAELTAGLPAEQAAIVKAAIERDTVKSKAAGWKQESEYQTLLATQQQLQAELDGTGGKPGTRAYQQWYKENFDRVKAQETAFNKYVEKYGTLEAPTQQQQQAASLTKEQVQTLMREEMNGQYVPKIGNTMAASVAMLQKHFLAGRKIPIDLAKIEELTMKNGGNLMAAYDEWDKPNQELADKEARDKEIDRRVNEELQKRGASARFPAAADMGPSALDARPKAVTDAYDPLALKGELASLWNETQAS